MPASIQNLYTQSRSLQAYTQALQVTGQNIASSADPSYARQQVNLQQTLPAGIDDLLGSSVEATIKDTRDRLIESQIRREQSDLAQQNEHLAYLEQLELTLFSGSSDPMNVGADGGEYLSDGLIKYVSEFFMAWSDLDAAPRDETAKSAVYSAAQSMVDRFHRDAASLAELRGTVEEAVAGSVESINHLLDQVAAMQEQIGRMPAENSSAKMDLLSQRDAYLSELSHYLSFTWTPNADPLQSTLAVRLADGSTATLITGGQVDSAVAWNGDTVSLSEGGSALAADRGRVGAQLRLLDEDITRFENHWNLLAGEMVRIVNGAYNAAGTPGRNFFNPDTATAASLQLEVSGGSAIRAGTADTGNELAAAIAGLFDRDLSADLGSPLAGSFSENLLAQQNRLANEINRERDAIGAQEKVVTFLEQEKSSRSGVDLDREVTNLLQFQRAFQATSRVLRALDESLQSFLSDIS